MSLSRREFLRRGTYALGATTLVSQFGMLSALAQTVADTGDYKALVCIFLNGGNDGFNTVVPLDDAEYGYYAAARPAIAIPQASLLGLNPASAGRPFGLHPSLTELQTLFTQQKLAVLCNVGTLLAPTTPQEYRSNPASRPTSLFDHFSQQYEWQNLNSGIGWGQSLSVPVKSLNTSARLPMLVNVTGGSSYFLAGTDPFISLAPNAPLSLQGFNSSSAATARYSALRQLQMLPDDAALVNVIADSTSKAIDDGQLASQVLGGNTVSTKFPTSSLGQQLLQIAKIISVRNSLGQNRRQVFFANVGSFDTHANQILTHQSLLRDLSQSMNAFYTALGELGVSPDVTTFTLSEFGRTFQNSGNGTDHAWGSFHFIMGDAVRGGDFYGRYPSIVVGGWQDVDTGTGARGRFLPTTSVDQYAATLAGWFGLDSAAIQAALPNIVNFSPTDLGFMASA